MSSTQDSDTFVPYSNEWRHIFEFSYHTKRFHCNNYKPEYTDNRLTKEDLDGFLKDINKILADSLNKPRGKYLCLCNFNLCFAILLMITGIPFIFAAHSEDAFVEYFLPILFYFAISIGGYIYFITKS